MAAARLLLGDGAEVPRVGAGDGALALRGAAAALARDPPPGADADGAYARAWAASRTAFVVDADALPRAAAARVLATLALVKLEALAALACDAPGAFVRVALRDGDAALARKYAALDTLHCPPGDAAWLGRTLARLFTDAAARTLSAEGAAVAAVAADVLGHVDAYGRAVVRPLLQRGAIAHVVPRAAAPALDDGNGWDGIWLVHGGAAGTGAVANIAAHLPARGADGRLEWRSAPEAATGAAWARALTAHWRAALAAGGAELGLWLELAAGGTPCGPFHSPAPMLPRPTAPSLRAASGAVARPLAAFGHVARRLASSSRRADLVEAVCACVGTTRPHVACAVHSACPRTMAAVAPPPPPPRKAQNDDLSRALAEVRTTINSILAADDYGRWLPEMRGVVGPVCALPDVATPLRATFWEAPAEEGAPPTPLLVLLPDALLRSLCADAAQRRRGERGEVSAVVEGELCLADALAIPHDRAAPIAEAVAHADFAPRAWRVPPRDPAPTDVRLPTRMLTDDALGGLRIRVVATTSQLPPQMPVFAVV